MTGFRTWCAAVCIIAFAAAFHAQAQTPIINPPNGSPPGLQSGIIGPSLIPSLPAAITVNTPVNGFVLFINGQFNTSAVDSVTWSNPAASQTAVLSTNSVSSTQVTVFIPTFLYQNFAVSSPQPVTVTLTEVFLSSQTSASATFTINPALAPPVSAFPAANGSLLLPGTLGVPYSQPLALNGTPPFSASLQGGAIPGGLSLPSNAATENLTGTPNALGTFNWIVSVSDAWGNALAVVEATEIVDVPTFTSLAPTVVPAGSPSPVAINGSNFVPLTSTAIGAFPVSTAGVLTGSPSAPFSALPTSFVNAGQLSATVSSLLPGTYNLEVQQPSGATSGTRTLTVQGPSITSLSPAGGTITARPTPFTVTINGANFVSNPVLSPSASIVLSNPSGTTFLNATTLTLTQIFTPGVLPIQVENPGGALSNIVNLTVLPAPTISSLSPPSATAGNPLFPQLLVSGTNFTNTMQVQMGNVLLPTTFISPTVLAATVPANLIASVGSSSVSVITIDGFIAGPVAFNILPAPSLISITPTSTPIPTPQTLTVTGTNFSNTMQIAFGGTRLATTFVNGTTLRATLSGAQVSTAGSIPVTVVTVDNFSTAFASFLVYGPLTITPLVLPGGTTGVFYNATLGESGGLPPFTWTATGLQSLSLNPRTGAISGLITAVTNMVLGVTVTDSNGTVASANVTIPVINPNPPVTITTGNALPTGTVGVAYSAVITAGGGVGNFTFAIDVGSLPPGLTLGSNGTIAGTPTSPGTFNFSVRATDSAGNLGTAGFAIIVKPAPLTVTGPASPATVVPGASVSLQFAATGGVQPYTFNVTGTLPPGTTFSRTGLLSGTASTPGTYSFTVLVSDSTGLQVTKNFTVTVSVPQLSVTGSLGGGQVGVAYSGTISATGGQAPYTLTASGLPPGLAFANGSVTGTPSAAGSYTVTASATDSAGTQATATFPVTIQPAGLTVTTASLANGTVGVAYTGSVSATGGAPPYTFSFSGLPPGVTGASNGSLSGAPTAGGSYSIVATATDAKSNTATKTYPITVATPPPLVITSASIPNATVGTAVSATFTATGGVPPYTWSATGLPAGLSLSAGGVLSGTPSAPSSASLSVTVKDSAGTTASQTVTFSTALPATPPLNLTGLPATSNPGTQSTLQIGIGTAYPVDVTVNLTLTFAPDSGQDDPSVQFSSGGRTATLTIPAGSLTALTSVGVQTGTVAGTATITARLVAVSLDITPSPAPARTIRINAAVPTATSVAAAVSGSGFTVTVIGYDTTRSISSAIFTFTAAAGANLQTTSVTVPVSSIFSAWYGSSASAPYGSQFTFTQPFNVQGGVTAIASVTVTLVNTVGSSAPASATLH